MRRRGARPALGRVHQHVHLAVALHGLGDHALDLLLVGDIDGEGHAITFEPADFFHGGLGGVLIAVDDDDLGPLLDEGADDPAAQMPAAAGHDRDFPVQHADCHSPYPA